jgi:diguanylate cyclase (GGDEF)-like protein/PAS domain S-box-containing protein
VTGKSKIPEFSSRQAVIKRVEEALQIEAAYLDNLFESAQEAIVMSTNDGKILRINKEFKKLFGYKKHEIIGKYIDDLVAPKHLREEAESLTMQVLKGKKISLDVLRRKKDGTLINVSIIGSPIIINGQQVAVYGIYRDITARKKAEDELHREKAFLEQLIESAQEAIVITENNGEIMRINSEFTRLFGYRQKEVKGRFVDDLIVPKKYYKEARQNTKTVAAGKKFSMETIRQNKAGKLFDVSLIGSPIIVNSQQVAVYGIYRDVTIQKRIEKELLESRKELLETNKSLQKKTKQLEKANKILKKLSNIDGLTGIANHRRFFEIFRKEWNRSIRNGSPISLLMCDVDFFKRYNDNYGHQKGDECLKKIAEALKKVLNRPGDFAARYGGEEFAVVLPETDSKGASTIAEKIRKHVQSLQLIHEKSTINDYVTISLGCATTIPKFTKNYSLLIKATDTALYRSKQRGRNRITVIDPAEI